MTNKIRRHIWPVSLMMSVAIIGALAAFLVLASGPGAVMAQGSGSDPCAGMTDEERATHILNGGTCGPTAEPLAMPMNVTADDSVSRQLTVAWDAVEGADSYGITWTPPNARGVSSAQSAQTTYVIDALEPDAFYTIRVTALHESDAELNSEPATIIEVTAPVAYSLMFSDHEADMPNERVIMATGEQVTIDARVSTDSSEETTVNVRIASSDGTMHFLGTEAPDPVTVAGVIFQTSGLKAGAGVRTIDDGSFDVRARDDSARVFQIHVTCLAPAGMDPQGVLDVEVRDEDQTVVAEGTITCAPPPAPPLPDPEFGDPDCFSVTGMPDENRDDVMRHATNPEMGQETVQVINGISSVQLTVTSCEAGPVYIRFLDSDMEVFGTDVDECDDPCVDAAGADVTGLASGQKLQLNMTNELGADMALMYDQYVVVTPGDGSAKYLQGNAGTYHQGKFRVHDPCDLGDFYVEVYEKDNKNRRMLENGMYMEKVACVGPASVQPTELSVTTYTDRSGEALMSWQPVAGAEYHHAIVIYNGQAVAGSYARIETPDNGQMDHAITGLMENREYIFAVAAENVGPDGTRSYSAPAYIEQVMDWR